MARVTVELRNLLKSDFQLFDFEYTFDDQDYKKELEQRVIDHFYDYEIGQETPEMFKHKFKTRWIQKIGYYNKLYNTTLLQYNPLTNYSISEALEQLQTSNEKQDTNSSMTVDGKTTEGNTTTTDQDVTGTNDQDTKRSDYPQQSIAGGDYLSGEEKVTGSNDQHTDGTVSSNGTVMTDDTTTTTGSQTNDGTVNTDYTKTIEGITGVTYQELIKAERENIVHITSGIIEEMKPCFILIY